MTLAEEISLAATVGTCVAAIAACIVAFLTFGTLRELRAQRTAAYKPELTPVQQQIFARFPQAATASIGIDWAEVDSGTLSDVGLGHRYFVRLFNLGNGAAKDVKVCWTYDVQKFVTVINSMAQRGFFDFFVVLSANQALSFESKKGSRATFFLRTELNSKYDYILPSSVEKEGLRVHLPSSFQRLVSLYYSMLFDSSTSKEEINKDQLGSPSIDCVIAYRDIAGNSYRSKFRFVVNVFVYQAGSVTEPNSRFDGLLEFSAVQA